MSRNMLVYHLCLVFFVHILSSGLLNAKAEPVSATTTKPDAPPKYWVQDGENYCIVLQGNLQLFVPYTNSKNETLTATIPVDRHLLPDGSCGATMQDMKLTWGSNNQPSFNLSLTFSKLPMSASGKEETVVSSVLFVYNVSDPLFPDIGEIGIRRANGTGPYFKTPSEAFFTCTAQQNITLTGNESSDVVFGLSALQMEAFRNSTNTDFSGSSYDCVQEVPKDNTIAIAVGVCFAILIVLAIVVFLIGNRRRAHGYQNI